MSAIYLNTPIELLPSLTAAKAQSLQKDLNIFTVFDLLTHFPFRYIDKSKVYKTSEISDEMPYIQLIGKISDFKQVGIGHKARLTATFEDEAGEIELVWFKGIQWVTKSITEGKEYIVFGKPQRFANKYNIAHPEIKPYSADLIKDQVGYDPIYSSTEGLKKKYLDSKGIHKLILQILSKLNPALFAESIPVSIIQEHRLISRKDAFKLIHNPSNIADIQAAEFRLKFEELFLLQLQLLKLKANRNVAYKGFVFEKIDHLFDLFYKKYLPYELTNAQKKVLKEIRRDTLSGRQMNRLLQGDVGSGKTIVGLMTMLMAVDNGHQACMMAPTEILAQQHLETIQSIMKDMPIRIALMTGSTKTKDKKYILQQLKEGAIDILIGTHALIEPTVEFKNLGLAVVDEQHKFGVAQRAVLWKKNTLPPHILVMTATPIPRTLAMTLYGDLDASVIDELPPGRKPIKTIHRFDAQRLAVWGFIKEEIQKGRQIYIVYPLIEESALLDHKALMEGFESVLRDFPQPQYNIAMVHGKMKSDEKDHEMQRFIKGEANILVATTVIEVGVNVPNASVMIIESAERFGLSQLHQLRGRVGRGADQSYCILMTKYELSKDARMRMKIMCETANGFVIAEEDLKMRGPGDLQGTRQSGEVDLRISNLAQDGAILQSARDAAHSIIDQDPDLKLLHHQPLLNFLLQHKNMNKGWSKIS